MSHAMDETLDCALGYQSAFMRMGFSADELFFALGTDRTIGVTVVRGERRLNFRCGALPSGVTPEMLFAAWKARAKAWNQSSQEDRERVYRKFVARTSGVTVVAALVDAGFEIASSVRS